MRKIFSIAMLISAAILLILIYGTFDPEKFKIYPKCPFYMLTGLECPGCGSQRAIYNLLNLNIHAAFKHNAFLVCMIPIIPIFLIVQAYKEKHPCIYNILFGTPFIVGILIITILWWIMRNILDI